MKRWKEVKLGEVCEKVSNSNPVIDFSSRSFMYVDIASIDKETKRLITISEILGVDAPSRARQIVHTNDILVSTVRPNLNAICRVEKEYDNAIASTGFCVIRLREYLALPTYVFFFVQSDKFVNELVQNATGANYPAVSDRTVKEQKIPLPPLPIQKQIAARLDIADALRRKDRELLTRYDALIQSLFVELFGDPVRNEKGWRIERAKNIIIDIVAGSSWGGEERELEKGEFGVLKISAVTSGTFKSTEIKVVPNESIKDRNLIFPKKGNLLFSRANTRELVAATCIVDKDYENIFLPDKLWRLDLDLKRSNQSYFKYILSQDGIRYDLTKTATGTSGSMLNISMEKLRNLKIPVPPLALQNHFAELVAQIEEQKALVQAQAARSEALFESLLQEAFG